MQIHTIGIDLGKTVFHLVGLNLRGEAVARRKCSRTQLLQFTANVQVDLIGMEACAGAHFLGRALREQGHEVRIIPLIVTSNIRPGSLAAIWPGL
jgi:transposase